MTRSKLYEGADRELYTMEDMVNRVVYWWVRYEGRRTEDGKDFCKTDVRELSHRLNLLSTYLERFKFNKPDMDDVKCVLNAPGGKTDGNE